MGILSPLSILAGCVALALAAAPAPAADHLDAPSLTPPGGDPALDITDIYAFRSPECDGCTVLVMGVNGLTGAGANASFNRRASYEFRVDTDGDAIRDINFKVKFGRERDGVQKLSVKMRHPGIRTSRIVRRGDGRTTPVGAEAVVNNGLEGIRVFAGTRDDPFFFDLPALLAWSNPG